MKRVALGFAIAACGGSAKPASTPRVIDTAPSECSKVAAHVSLAMFTWKAPPPTTKDKVAQVITEHCEQDQWSAEAKSCFGKITDEASAKPCVTTLTKDQHDKVMQAMESKLDHKQAEMPASVGAPTRAPSKGADPCEGGE